MIRKHLQKLLNLVRQCLYNKLFRFLSRTAKVAGMPKKSNESLVELGPGKSMQRVSQTDANITSFYQSS